MRPNIEALLAIFGAYARDRGVDLPILEVHLYTSLSETLSALAPRAAGVPVKHDDLERLGGTVMGKTIPLEEDWSAAAIVVPGAGFFHPDMRVQSLALFLLA